MWIVGMKIAINMFQRMRMTRGHFEITNEI